MCERSRHRFFSAVDNAKEGVKDAAVDLSDAAATDLTLLLPLTLH